MGGLVEKCPEAGTAPAGRNADRQEIGGPGAGGGGRQVLFPTVFLRAAAA